MAHRQLIFKTPQADLKQRYPRWVEIGLVLSLLVTVSLFLAFQRFETSLVLKNIVEEPLKVEKIPRTEMLKPPPKPERPKIPVEAEADEEMPEDFDIDEIFDYPQELADVPPPPEEDEPVVEFHAVSVKPREIKRVNPVYPELAQKAGIEAQVVVKVLINTRGEVEDALILKGHPLFDAAALTAARQFRFTPAEQRDRKVKVWISIPFNFRLN